MQGGITQVLVQRINATAQNAPRIWFEIVFIVALVCSVLGRAREAA